MGVQPALGRTFVRDDETYGRHRVVILSDGLWKRRFEADRSVIGRTIIVDGEPHQVVGVMPPRFSFPEGSEIWAPIAFDPKTPPRRDSRYFTPIGRLKARRHVSRMRSRRWLCSPRGSRRNTRMRTGITASGSTR